MFGAGHTRRIPGADSVCWLTWFSKATQRRRRERTCLTKRICPPLIHGNAEASGLPDTSFDLAASEYGASIWADPYRWIPKAARLLRPGGELVFLTNGTLWLLTVPDTEEEGPATERLLRFSFGMLRFEWSDDPGVEFHLRLRRLGPPAAG